MLHKYVHMEIKTEKNFTNSRNDEKYVQKVLIINVSIICSSNIAWLVSLKPAQDLVNKSMKN